MNRRQKIIVSITGIFIVLLALVGITFAYFIAQIQGNENSTSVSVVTANLKLIYAEDTNEIQGINNALPGYKVTKTFAAINVGNNKVNYVVTLENIINELNRQEDLVYTLTCNAKTIDESHYNSGQYSGQFSGQYSGQSGQTIGTCNGISSETQFPPTGDYSVVVENTIEVGIVHEYELTVHYKEMNVDQSIDMNKTFSALVNIRDKYQVESGMISGIGSGSSNSALGSGLLAENIIYNSQNNINGTIYSETPLTSPAEKISGESEATLSMTEDDDGPSYYFRGNVQDNYVTFADMCWRIVRIQGDGSIKLILEDQDEVCSETMNGNWAIPTEIGGSTYTGNFGYTRYDVGMLTASDGTKNSSYREIMDYLNGTMASAFKNFQKTFTDEELEKLKSGDWCLADKGYSRSGTSNSTYEYTALTETEIYDNKVKGIEFYYDSYRRLSGENKDGYSPTLKCNGTVMKDFDDVNIESGVTTAATPMYVGGITSDEIVYAGGKYYSSSNKNYYLINEEFKKGRDGANKSSYFWSLSPSGFRGTYDLAMGVYFVGNMFDYSVNVSETFRPSVTLESGIEISEGEGTQKKPYVIK